MTYEMSQLLLVFGFVWMVVGCLAGLTQGIKHTQHLMELELQAKGNNLLGYHKEFIAFKQKTTAHTHIMLFPLVSIAIALAMPQMSFSGVYSTALGVGLIAATIIWTLGGIFNVKPLKGLGDLLLLASIVMTVFGLVN